MRYDRIIRKSYLIVRTTLHSDGCFCDKCMKKSLIGRCGGIGVEQLKPKNIFYRLYLQLKPYVLLTILIVGCENEPLTDMVGDTLTIDVSYYHPYTTELESQSFQIVLE